jgi:ankyrin repeat protein
VRVVEALIDGGTPVDLPARRGWSPLFLACRDGREEVVRLLLARGANAGHRSAHGDTAAHWAADSDRAGAVALLFAAPGGAAAIAAQNGGGMTPLGRAVASGSVACEDPRQLQRKGRRERRGRVGPRPQAYQCSARPYPAQV